MLRLKAGKIMVLICLSSALFGILQANPISDPKIDVQVTPKNISVPYGGTSTLHCNTNSNYNKYEHPAIIWQCYQTGLSTLGVSSINCSDKVHREGKTFGDCSIFSESVSSCELKVELIRNDFTCKCILDKEVDLARVYVVHVDSLDKSDSLSTTTSSASQTSTEEEFKKRQDNTEIKSNLPIVLNFVALTVIIILVIILIGIIYLKIRNSSMLAKNAATVNSELDSYNFSHRQNNDDESADTRLDLLNTEPLIENQYKSTSPTKNEESAFIESQAHKSECATNRQALAPEHLHKISNEVSVDEDAGEKIHKCKGGPPDETILEKISGLICFKKKNNSKQDSASTLDGDNATPRHSKASENSEPPAITNPASDFNGFEISRYGVPEHIQNHSSAAGYNVSVSPDDVNGHENSDNNNIVRQ